MILPVAKLGTLLLKTMPKPIATRLKTEASRHPKFRQFISNLVQVGGRAAMEYTRDGAHGAASGEGAESSSSIVRGEGIRQDMSHAKLKTICHQAAGEDVEVEMCCKVDTTTQYAFVEFKTRDLSQALQNLEDNPELASVIWKSMAKPDYWRLSERRPSHEYEVHVGGLSTQSPKELEKVCTESVGNVKEVVMYGNYAFVYFNTKESAMEAILKKDLMVTPQEKKKDLKGQRIIAIASKNKLSIKNLPISWTSNELNSAADEAGPGVLKSYITEDTYSYDKDGLIEYQNQACAAYGMKRIMSTKKLRPHKDTVTVGWPAMQKEKQDIISYTIGDEKSYIDFINDLRNKLVDFHTCDVVEDIFMDDCKRGAHRVLDKHPPDKQPVQWIRIELRAGQEGKESTILAVRKHNVYIKGFTGKKDGRRRWLELPEGDKEDDGMKLPRGYKAEKLDGWSVSYNGVMKLNDLEQVKKTLSNTRLGMAFAKRAVGRLSRYPDDMANNDNDDIPVRLAMAGLIVMICEAARMNPCLDAIAGGWTRGTGLTTRMKDIIWDWSNMSAALLKWKEDGYRKWPYQRTDSPGHALSSVYLVLNTNAKIEGTNRAWVEIFSVKANFHPDGMTIKVFNGGNEGHIIYQKVKQQGEQDKAAANSIGHQQIGGGVGQHEMFPLELKSGKCSSGNEWFGISVGDGGSSSSSSTKFKWSCRKQDGRTTELVTRNINFDSERSIDVTYLVMSDAVKATVKVHLRPKVDPEYNNKLTEKEGKHTKPAKKYTVRHGKIYARIGDFEGQIMLLSPGEKCEIAQNELALSLPRHDVMVPHQRQLRIYMVGLDITDNNGNQVVNISHGTFSFDFLSSGPTATDVVGDSSGIKVGVTWPTQTKMTEMKTELVWTIGDGNKFTELIKQLRDICAKSTLRRGKRSLLIKRREEAPPEWVHIKLELEGEETSSITLAIRDDVLFGAGFMNQAGVWYSLISPDTDIKLLGEQYNSVSLGWGRTYNQLVEPSGQTLKEAIESLDKDFVKAAVRTLSRYPDVEDGEKPSLALAGLSVVFCESAIWEPLKEHLKYVWEMKEDDPKRKSIKEPLEEYIQKWFAISCALLSWNASGKWNPPEPTGDGSTTLLASIKNEQDALKHIRLVYNGPPRP